MKPLYLVTVSAALILSGCVTHTTVTTTVTDVPASQGSQIAPAWLADQSQYPPYVTLTKLSDVHRNTKVFRMGSTQNEE